MRIKLRNKRRGFTLAELMVTMVLYAIVMIMIMGVLLPAVKFSSRYLESDNDTAFLKYAQRALTERLRYSNSIIICNANSLDPAVANSFARPSDSGYYDISHNLFKMKVKVDWSTEEQLVSIPVKLAKGTNVVVFIDWLTDGTDRDLSVKLSLERNNEIVNEVIFPVRALNTDVMISEHNEGWQAIYVE